MSAETNDWQKEVDQRREKLASDRRELEVALSGELTPIERTLTERHLEWVADSEALCDRFDKTIHLAEQGKTRRTRRAARRAQRSLEKLDRERIDLRRQVLRDLKGRHV